MTDTAAAKAWLITILRREHARLFERKTPAIENLDDVDIPETEQATPEQLGDDALIRRAMAALDHQRWIPLLSDLRLGLFARYLDPQSRRAGRQRWAFRPGRGGSQASRTRNRELSQALHASRPPLGGVQ